MSSTTRSIPAFYIGVVMFAIGLLVATLLHSGPFANKGSGGKPENGSATGLFKLDGEVVTITDLSYVYAADLHELETRAAERKVQILRQAALDLHLRKLAAEQGKPAVEVQSALMGNLPVTEEEINQFYNDNQARIGRPLFEVKEAIGNALKQEKENVISQELISGLEQQGKLEIFLPDTTAPIARFDLTNMPFAGSGNAPVTIVEFFDYRCSHCKTASATLQNLLDENPQNLRWVVMDFPLLGGVSRQLAAGAYCAMEQGKYWEFHHELFAAQGSLHADSPLSIAEKLTLDKPKFESCLTSTAANTHVDNTQQQGLSVGVKGTPAIFINGLPYSNGNLESDLRNAVQQAIQAHAS